jgi:Flp pilus assembly protein TadG
MALPSNRPYNEVYLTGHMADLATASSTAYIAATHRGRLKRAFTIIANSITTANATVSVKVNGTTIGTITVTTSGSAAGDVDTAYFGYQGTANFVSEGDLITFVSDGASDTTTITRCTAVIERSN